MVKEIKPIQPKNPLEEALGQLDLQATLVLLSILSQRALFLQQEDARKTKISKLMKPDTAIKLPSNSFSHA
jgi:hypothetical protein